MQNNQNTVSVMRVVVVWCMMCGSAVGVLELMFDVQVDLEF